MFGRNYYLFQGKEVNRGFLVNPDAERQPGNTGFHGVFTVARPKKYGWNVNQGCSRKSGSCNQLSMKVSPAPRICAQFHEVNIVFKPGYEHWYTDRRATIRLQSARPRNPALHDANSRHRENVHPRIMINYYSGRGQLRWTRAAPARHRARWPRRYRC